MDPLSRWMIMPLAVFMLVDIMKIFIRTSFNKLNLVYLSRTSSNLFYDINILTTFIRDVYCITSTTIERWSNDFSQPRSKAVRARNKRSFVNRLLIFTLFYESYGIRVISMNVTRRGLFVRIRLWKSFRKIRFTTNC